MSQLPRDKEDRFSYNAGARQDGDLFEVWYAVEVKLSTSLLGGDFWCLGMVLKAWRRCAGSRLLDACWNGRLNCYQPCRVCFVFGIVWFTLDIHVHIGTVALSHTTVPYSSLPFRCLLLLYPLIWLTCNTIARERHEAEVLCFHRVPPVRRRSISEAYLYARRRRSKIL